MKQCSILLMFSCSFDNITGGILRIDNPYFIFNIFQDFYDSGCSMSKVFDLRHQHFHSLFSALVNNMITILK